MGIFWGHFVSRTFVLEVVLKCVAYSSSSLTSLEIITSPPTVSPKHQQQELADVHSRGTLGPSADSCSVAWNVTPQL